MEVENKKMLEQEKSNALIVVLFFLQYGLLLPFTVLLKSQLLIAFFTLFLFLYALITKRFKINSKTVILFLIPFSLLVLKLPFENYNPDGQNIALKMLISYITIGFSGILIGSLKFSYDHFLSYGLKLSWIIFILLCIIPFTAFYRVEVNHMRFGYSILPSVLFSFSYLFKKERTISTLVLFILSLTELVLFGARGALLTFVLYVFIYIYVISALKTSVKFYFTFIIVLMTMSANILLELAVNVLAYFKINSYSITKYSNLLNGSSLASTSSGRSEAYELAYSRIEDSLFFGSPMNTSYLDTGLLYYHNIFLDIIVNFGLFVFLGFILFIIRNLNRANKNVDKEFKFVFLIFFMTSIGRLIVSSSLWSRPEFWVFMSFCINFNKKKI